MEPKEKKLHPAVKEFFKRVGAKGGRAGKGSAKARSSEQARKAAMARWAKRKKPA